MFVESYDQQNYQFRAKSARRYAGSGGRNVGVGRLVGDELICRLVP